MADDNVHDADIQGPSAVPGTGSRTCPADACGRQARSPDCPSEARECPDEAHKRPSGSRERPAEAVRLSARALQTDREQSSIPAATGVWRFPSEQQFYKATTLKGHVISEESMPAVVQIHNAVNEETWRRILKFEKLHEEECPNPKLLRFVGSPNRMSLRAQLYNFLGFEAPFDSHHWFVDRCGHQKRYLIDYYDGKSNSTDPTSVSIFIDARPEFSFEGCVDQLKLYLMSRGWLLRGNAG